MDYFAQGHSSGSLFDKLLGRELQPPWVPKVGRKSIAADCQGETYCDPEELDVSLSDDDELAKPMP